MNEHTKSIKILKKLKQNWALLCVGILFIAGFLLRLFVVLNNEIEPIDALQYMEIAKSIIGVKGNTYIVPREPFFPFLLSLVFLIFPDTFLTARFFTAFLGSITIVLVYFVVKKYSQEFSNSDKYEKFGLVSSLIICFNYNIIVNDGNGVRESLYGLLFLVLFYSILIKNKLAKRIVFTITSFLLILTKTESLILLIGLVLILYYKENILANKNIKELKQNEDENKNLDNVENNKEIKNDVNKIRGRMLNYIKSRNYNFAFILLLSLIHI